MAAFDPTRPFLMPDLPGLPTFTTPMKKATAQIPPVNVVGTAPPIKRGRGGVPITAIDFTSGTPRTTGMVPFRPGLVPASQNAVTAAGAAAQGTTEPTPVVPVADQPNYAQPQQGEVRKAERGVYNPATPGVSDAEAAQGTTGSTSPGGMGYKASPTSGAGITRVDAVGQSPLFTNLEPGFALDDINKKGRQLPSVPGVLSGVKEGGFGLVAPGATQTQAYSPYRAKADQLMQQADQLFSSGGLVDSWRARGVRRQANELNNAAAAVEQNQNQQQANRIHEKQVGNQFQIGSEQLATQRRGQDFGLAANMSDILIGKGVTDAMAKGDLAKARDIATVRSPRVGNPSEYTTITNAAGKVIGKMDKRTGVMEPVADLEAMQQQMMLKAEQQARAEAAKKAKQ